MSAVKISVNQTLALGLELATAPVWRINLHGLAPGKLERGSMRRVRNNGMHRAIGGHRHNWVDRPPTQMIRLTGRRADRLADTGAVMFVVYAMIRSLTQFC